MFFVAQQSQAFAVKSYHYSSLHSFSPRVAVVFEKTFKVTVLQAVTTLLPIRS